MSSKKSFRSGNIWTFAIGAGLFIWGTICLVFLVVWSRNITGTPWLMLAGGVMIIAGISNTATYRYNREKVLGALKSYERISLANLASELKMSEKQTKDVVIDLRTEGQLKAPFEPETGDIMVLEVKGVRPIAVVPMSSSGLPEHEANLDKSNVLPEHPYCQFCGSIVKPKDQFCNNCGSSIK